MIAVAVATLVLVLALRLTQRYDRNRVGGQTTVVSVVPAKATTSVRKASRPRTTRVESVSLAQSVPAEDRPTTTIQVASLDDPYGPTEKALNELGLSIRRPVAVSVAIAATAVQK